MIGLILIGWLAGALNIMPTSFWVVYSCAWILQILDFVIRVASRVVANTKTN